MLSVSRSSAEKALPAKHRFRTRIVRTTYLIENGVIVKAFGKVKAADNPKQMLEELA